MLEKGQVVCGDDADSAVGTSRESDYDPSYIVKRQLLAGDKIIPRLKKTAIPSLDLPSSAK